MKEAITIVSVFAILLLGIYFWRDIKGIVVKDAKGGNKEKSVDEELSGNSAASGNVKILQNWNMPDELLEISGISYVNEKQFATVQDEEGTVFLYNLESKKIDRKIPFAGPGDYEGVAVAGNTIFVVQADGQLYEITDFSNTKPKVQQYKTSLTVKDNIEGLCYDQKNNRLLLASKDGGNDMQKAVYAFDLSKKQLYSKPVFTIDVNNEAFKSKGKKKQGYSLQPSAIAVHPISSDIYITDGPKARLVIFNESGVKQVYQLNESDFPQAEGITFTPKGEMFISNEGKKGTGTILKVEVE